MTSATKTAINDKWNSDRLLSSTVDKRRKNLKVAGILTVLVIGMISLSFAAVPLYELFCRVTGYSGTTQVAKASSTRIVNQTIWLDFDTNVANDLPWRFAAPNRVEMKLGEERLVTFEAVNLSDQPILATSVFNASPFKIGKYVQKTECFCFTEQLLLPGEAKKFPVTFFIDPEMAEDQNSNEVRAITLSYTFFNKGQKALEQYLSQSE